MSVYRDELSETYHRSLGLSIRDKPEPIRRRGITIKERHGGFSSMKVAFVWGCLWLIVVLAGFATTVSFEVIFIAAAASGIACFALLFPSIAKKITGRPFGVVFLKTSAYVVGALSTLILSVGLAVFFLLWNQREDVIGNRFAWSAPPCRIKELQRTANRSGFVAVVRSADCPWFFEGEFYYTVFVLSPGERISASNLVLQYSPVVRGFAPKPTVAWNRNSSLRVTAAGIESVVAHRSSINRVAISLQR